MSLPADHPALVATMTRMRLRHVWDLWPAVRRFRELYRHAQRDPAFIRGHWSLADPWTVFNYSIWANRRAMVLWSGATGHTEYVRWAHRHCQELWSSEWQLTALSRGARNWHGVVGASELRYTDDFGDAGPR